MLRNRFQRGFTISETILIVGILGAIAGGIWFFLMSQKEKRQIETLEQQLLVIAQAIRTVHGPHQGFDRLTNLQDITAPMIASGAVPGDVIAGDRRTLVTPWNGAITLYASSEAPDHVRLYPTFEIRYAELPPKACKALITYLVPISASLGLVFIQDRDGWKKPDQITEPDLQINCGRTGNIVMEWLLNPG